MSINHPPIQIGDAIKEAIISLGFQLSDAELAERVEGARLGVIKEIRRRQVEIAQEPFGYFYDLALSDINENIVHGSCYIFKSDGAKSSESKSKRSNYFATSELINELTFSEFEGFCGIILKVLGVDRPVVSRASNDQGIDFFGLWEHQSYLQESALTMGMEKQLRTWIFGQAKKYDRTGISTAQIRELVGSVHLAKTKTFSSTVDEYNFQIRPCDPVFHFFITTGRTTSGVRELMLQSGVIFLDSILIAIFLCDRVPDLDKNIADKNMFLDFLNTRYRL